MFNLFREETLYSPFLMNITRHVRNCIIIEIRYANAFQLSRFTMYVQYSQVCRVVYSVLTLLHFIFTKIRRFQSGQLLSLCPLVSSPLLPFYLDNCKYRTNGKWKKKVRTSYEYEGVIPPSFLCPKRILFLSAVLFVAKPSYPLFLLSLNPCFLKLDN